MREEACMEAKRDTEASVWQEVSSSAENKVSGQRREVEPEDAGGPAIGMRVSVKCPQP